MLQRTIVRSVWVILALAFQLMACRESDRTTVTRPADGGGLADGGPEMDGGPAADGGPEVDGGAVETDLTPEQFVDALYDAYCRRHAQCYTTSSYHECRQTFAREQAWELKAGSAGRWTLDQDNAQACLEQLSQARCGASVLSVIPECLAAVRGSLPAQADCQSNYECVSGRCNYPRDDCGHSTCSARALEHEACAPPTLPCRDGFTCVEGTCVAAAGIGERCGKAAGRNCNDLLVCMPDDPSARDPDGECVLPMSQGDVCSSNGQCRPGHFCERAEGQTLGTCQPFQLQGESCRLGVFTCVAPLLCQSAKSGERTGTCEPLRPVGASCLRNSSICVPSAYCRESTGTCVAGANLGERCGFVGPSGYIPCRTGVCSGPYDEQRCAEYGQINDQCGDGQPCDPSLVCELGHCVAWCHPL